MIISTFFKKTNPNPIYRIRIRIRIRIHIRSRISKRREEEWNVITSHLEIQYRIEKRRRSFKEFPGVSRCFQEKEQKKKVMHIHSRQLTHTTCYLLPATHYIHYITKETQKKKKKKKKKKKEKKKEAMHIHSRQLNHTHTIFTTYRISL